MKPLRRAPSATALLLLLAVVLPWQAVATTVLPMSPAEVDEAAERIFVGTCVSVSAASLDALEAPVTRYVFEVEEAIKGDAVMKAASTRTRHLVFHQYGGPTAEGGYQGIIGLPRYQVGKRYRLALHADSRIGLTSPVGLGQGAQLLNPDRPAGAKR